MTDNARRRMKMAATEPKDVARLQFDVRRAQLDIIERLVDTCGLRSKKELFSNAMALMKWAVQETQKGRRIASYDPHSDTVEVIALPALDFVTPADADMKNAESVKCRENAFEADSDALAARDARVKAETLREVTHQMPRYFGVWSSTGVHIGTWGDGRIAAEVLDEYPGGVIRDLIPVDAVLPLIPSDQEGDE